MNAGDMIAWMRAASRWAVDVVECTVAVHEWVVDVHERYVDIVDVIGVSVDDSHRVREVVQ